MKKCVILFLSLVFVVSFCSCDVVDKVKESTLADKAKGAGKYVENEFIDMFEPDDRVDGVYIYSDDKNLKALELSKDSTSGMYYLYNNKDGLEEISIMYNAERGIASSRNTNVFHLYKYEVNKKNNTFSTTELGEKLTFNEKENSFLAEYMTDNGFKDEIYKKSTKEEYNKILKKLQNKK